MGYKRRVETSDAHKVETLRTRYYKADAKKCLSSIEEYAKKNNLSVVNVNYEFKEILIKKDNIDIIASVIEINPIEAAVDLNIINKPYDLLGIPLPDFNACQKVATEIYSHLDKVLMLKKVGGKH